MLRIVHSFSQALDLADVTILNHSQRVAYIVLKIAEELGLTAVEIRNAVLAALVHDIGISKSQWRLESHNLLPNEDLITDHCLAGAELISGVSSLRPLVETVACHHDLWKGPNKSGKAQEDIPLAARLIHLADRVEVQLDSTEYVLNQKKQIDQRISALRGHFWPEALEAFHAVSSAEAFWLDLATDNFEHQLWALSSRREPLVYNTLQEIADLFATVIDRKSPFTAKHSHGVAICARWLAKKAGFSEPEIKDMYIAGLLHDLGKLAVPDEILEYPGRLSFDQMLVMKQHTYHTYHLLTALQKENIQEWAAFHHEKLDGSGYPFRVGRNRLDTGSRIMAIADIFQALHEDRPYRKGLSLSETQNIIMEMVAENKLDGDLTELLFTNYPELEEELITL